MGREEARLGRTWLEACCARWTIDCLFWEGGSLSLFGLGGSWKLEIESKVLYSSVLQVEDGDTLSSFKCRKSAVLKLSNAYIEV